MGGGHGHTHRARAGPAWVHRTPSDPATRGAAPRSPFALGFPVFPPPGGAIVLVARPRKSSSGRGGTGTGTTLGSIAGLGWQREQIPGGEENTRVPSPPLPAPGQAPISPGARSAPRRRVGPRGRPRRGARSCPGRRVGGAAPTRRFPAREVLIHQL